MINQNDKECNLALEVSNLYGIMQKIIGLKQQNSIHVDFSDEDIRKMEEQENSIINALKNMHDEAMINLENARTAYDKKLSEIDSTNNQLTMFNHRFDEMKQKQCELEAVYAERKSRVNLCQELCDMKNREVNDLEEIVRQNRQLAEEQNEKLRKYCWVPFYGLYLAIDKLADNKEVDFEHAIHEREISYQRLSKIQEDARISQQELDIIEEDVKKAQKDFDNIGNEIVELKKQLVCIKNNLIQCELILSETNALNNMIKNAEINPEQIVAMQADLNKLMKEAREYVK